MKRMSFWLELKWLVAIHLVDWGLKLMYKEMSAASANSLLTLKLEPDPVYQTVPMHPKSVSKLKEKLKELSK